MQVTTTPSRTSYERILAVFPAFPYPGAYHSMFISHLDPTQLEYNPSNPVTVQEGVPAENLEDYPAPFSDDQDHREAYMEFFNDMLSRVKAHNKIITLLDESAPHSPAKVKDELTPEEQEHNRERLSAIVSANEIAHEHATCLVRRLRSLGHDWPNIHADVNLVVNSCVPYITLNYRKKLYNQAKAINSPFPSHTIQVDTAFFATPSTVREVSFSRLLVHVDVFSGFVILEPLCSTKKKECMRSLNKIFHRFGTPQVIMADNGPEYQGICNVLDT